MLGHSDQLSREIIVMNTNGKQLSKRLDSIGKKIVILVQVKNHT